MKSIPSGMCIVPNVSVAQAARVVDRPRFMELTFQTMEGFIRFAISEGNASYLEHLLKTGRVRSSVTRTSA
jgi:hypothetical protein